MTGLKKPKHMGSNPIRCMASWFNGKMGDCLSLAVGSIPTEAVKNMAGRIKNGNGHPFIVRAERFPCTGS